MSPLADRKVSCWYSSPAASVRSALAGAVVVLVLQQGCREQVLISSVPTKTTASETGSAASSNPAALRLRTDSARPAMQPPSRVDAAGVHTSVPSWAPDAIFYQIFPERFANGDPSNDPTRDSLESPNSVPETWTVSSWTADWYARADWERQMGPDFFEHGVFHRRYGGDLQGVLNKLDYLQKLGVNAIYFNPLFYANSLHKYDGNSFHHIDPHFGPDPHGDYAIIAKEGRNPECWQWTAADKLFLALVQQAHARGMRVLVDGVFNHTGRNFFAFADLRKNQAASPYADWYIIQHFDAPRTPRNEFRYKGWWGYESLPEFANDPSGNDLHPGPKAYIFAITRRWMDPDGDGDPSDGIDGWRLDVASDMPSGFWRDWHQHARAINPDCYTSAEFWDEASTLVDDGCFSATMNYHGFAYPVKGFLIDRVLPPSGAAQTLDRRRASYPVAVQYAVQNLVDSHDTDRLASSIVNAAPKSYSRPDRFDFDTNASPRYAPDYKIRKPSRSERRVQRLVALLQMTYVGAPMIYYGTEAGMWGADDPCCRMPMLWPELKYASQQLTPIGESRDADSVTFDTDLFNFYRAAVRVRREQESLRRGDLRFITADDDAWFLGFRRTAGNDSLLVGLNRGDAPYTWTIDLGASERIEVIFTTSERRSSVSTLEEHRKAAILIPGLEGVVLQVSRKR